MVILCGKTLYPRLSCISSEYSLIGYWLEDGTGRKALAVQKAVPSIVTVAAESTLPVPISANAGS